MPKLRARPNEDVWFWQALLQVRPGPGTMELQPIVGRSAEIAGVRSLEEATMTGRCVRPDVVVTSSGRPSVQAAVDLLWPAVVNRLHERIEASNADHDQKIIELDKERTRRS